jgi:hypothetical protein
LQTLGQALVILGFTSWVASWGGLLLVGWAAAYSRQPLASGAALLLAQPILAAGIHILTTDNPGSYL